MIQSIAFPMASVAIAFSYSAIAKSQSSSESSPVAHRDLTCGPCDVEVASDMNFTEFNSLLSSTPAGSDYTQTVCIQAGVLISQGAQDSGQIEVAKESTCIKGAGKDASGIAGSQPGYQMIRAIGKGALKLLNIGLAGPQDTTLRASQVGKLHLDGVKIESTGTYAAVLAHQTSGGLFKDLEINAPSSDRGILFSNADNGLLTIDIIRDSNIIAAGIGLQLTDVTLDKILRTTIIGSTAVSLDQHDAGGRISNVEFGTELITTGAHALTINPGSSLGSVKGLTIKSAVGNQNFVSGVRLDSGAVIETIKETVLFINNSNAIAPLYEFPHSYGRIEAH